MQEQEEIHLLPHEGLNWKPLSSKDAIAPAHCFDQRTNLIFKSEERAVRVAFKATRRSQVGYQWYLVGCALVLRRLAGEAC